MNRRSFLRWGGVASASLLAGRSLTGCDPSRPATPAPTLADTGPALPRRLPASVTKAKRDEIDAPLHVLSGELPGDLRGHVFVVAAIPFGDGTPLFNGDGMIWRFDFDGAGAAFKSRLCKPPCYWADLAAAGTPHAFQNGGPSRYSSTLGFRNPLNTAFLPMKDRLLVTVDAARPYEIDPVSLEVVSPVGALEEWTPGLPENVFPGSPFTVQFTTAHPFYDERTGEMITVNYTSGPNGQLDLVRWDGEGKLERWPLVLPDGAPVLILQSAHQVAVTRDHVLVMDTAFVAEPEQIFGGTVSRAQAPEATVYIARRKDLVSGGGPVTAQKATLPRESVHFFADYDDEGGLITVHAAHCCAFDVSEWIREDDVRADGKPMREDFLGFTVAATDLSALGRHVIDASTGALVKGESITLFDESLWGLALYAHAGNAPAERMAAIYWSSGGFSEEAHVARVAELYADYPHRTVPLDEMPLETQPGHLLRFDPRAGVIADVYRFPDGRAPQSPHFVPRSGGTGAQTDGYITCIVLSDDTSAEGSSGDELWIFDAANLAQGPLCRLGHAQLDLPLSLHTAYLPKLVPATGEYWIDPRLDYAARLASAPPEVKALMEEHVFPHFD
ncbi:carotenoid oxygenase family protein [Polyangium aurulentum]|uniref:carotenoid oxygenase family protein n=1 Tax=Polyangium aurulentum TaxID=2567896 RepID=UPI0010ADDFF5|nr:carotenoid oxygenase family protein [Polyangium aurulentum]UQA63270.1 carotenoid oxygenase family protein [Polyangium aurulentum]